MRKFLGILGFLSIAYVLVDSYFSPSTSKTSETASFWLIPVIIFFYPYFACSVVTFCNMVAGWPGTVWKIISGTGIVSWVGMISSFLLSRQPISLNPNNTIVDHLVVLFILFGWFLVVVYETALRYKADRAPLP